MHQVTPAHIRITAQQAKIKAEAYCAYQERAPKDVRDKLRQWGLATHDTETIVAELTATGFLNEERFAHAYASGKLRMNGWGRLKIKQGLLHKAIPSALIRAALTSLDETTYRDKLLNLLRVKAATERERHPQKRKAKLARYAAGKGFEHELIFELLNTNEL